MKKIYIECDTIIELAQINMMLDTVKYDGEKYVILNTNLKGMIKGTMDSAIYYGYGKVDEYKSILGIPIKYDLTLLPPK